VADESLAGPSLQSGRCGSFSILPGPILLFAALVRESKKPLGLKGFLNGPPQTRTGDPLIKSSEPEHTTDTNRDVSAKKTKG